MFDPDVFRKQIHCVEESTCNIVVTFRRPPQWFGAHGIVSPLPPPRYAPVSSMAHFPIIFALAYFEKHDLLQSFFRYGIEMVHNF